MNFLYKALPGLYLACLLCGCTGEEAVDQRLVWEEHGDVEEAFGLQQNVAVKSAGLLPRNKSAPPSQPAEQIQVDERERMVISTAHLGLEIASFEQWMPQVQKLVHEHQGYIVNASTQQVYENAKKGRLVMRIPQAHFETVLGALKSGARKEESEQRGGQDITEEFYDLAARLTNKKKTEKRFQEILQSASSVEDILAVERELSRLREEIERLKGRKRYLQDRVRLSTITINWHEPYPLGVSQQGTSFWETIGKGFEDGIKLFARALQGLIKFAIALVPILIFLCLVIWGLIRLLRRNRQRSVL